MIWKPEKQLITVRMENPDPDYKKIYTRLMGIQFGDIEDKFGWTEIIG
jgi:hypothetical protein